VLPHCSDIQAKNVQVFGAYDPVAAQSLAWWTDVHMPEDWASLYMDTSLACLFAGWIPPFRPKVARTLKAPQYKDVACSFPGCKIRNCTGNITFWTDNNFTGMGYRCAVSRRPSVDGALVLVEWSACRAVGRRPIS
jgi:hypothetical protein